MSDERNPEQIYGEAIREAKDEYRTRTTDPFIHFLNIKLLAEKQIADARAVYDAAKAEAGSIYLEQIQSAWTFYRTVRPHKNINPASLNKRVRKAVQK